MSPIQSEAIFFCMLASLLWAPVVYVIASGADRKQSAVMSEKIWMLALAAAIAPTFVAPVLSVAGVSLRSAPQVAAWTSAIETMITPPTVFKPADAAPGESAQEYWTPAPSVIEAELGGAMSAAAARTDNPARKSAPDDAAKRAQGGAALQETPEEGVITLTMTTRANGASALSPGAIPPESRFSDGARTPLAPRDQETAASPLDDSAYAGAGAAQDFVARGFESRVSATTIANLTGLLYVYGALMAALLWLLKSGAFFIRFLGAQPVADSALLEAVERRRQALGIRRRVRIKQSSKLTSVCVYGYFMPSILIPSGLLRRAAHDDLEMMCAHELAHVKRGDVSLFTLGALLRVIFWFNPFVKAIAGRLELAAEQGADDLVVANGVSKRAYAACFIEGLRYAIASRTQQDRANLSSQLGPILTPSFTPQDRKGRRKRLDGILAAGHGASLKTSTKMLLGGVSVIASAAVFAQASLAVSPQAQADGAIGAIALPVDGAIMKGFGALGPDYDPGKPHQGVDIRAKRGADVRTPREGVVVDVIDNGANGWGKTVLIDHGAGLKTRYAHLDSYAVSKGAVLRAGQVIGKVGSTGEATRAHLHFETIVDGVAADPMILVNADKVAIEPSPAPKATPEPDPAPEPQSAPEPEPAAEPEPAPKNLITVSGKVKTRVAPNDVIADAIGDTADAIAEAIADAIDEAKDGILDEATLGADLAEEISTLNEDLTKIARDKGEPVSHVIFASVDDGVLSLSLEGPAQVNIRQAHAHGDAKNKAARKAAEKAAERERRTAERAVERERERAFREQERARERAERALERALERAERRADRTDDRTHERSVIRLVERETERAVSEAVSEALRLHERKKGKTGRVLESAKSNKRNGPLVTDIEREETPQTRARAKQARERALAARYGKVATFGGAPSASFDGLSFDGFAFTFGEANDERMRAERKRALETARRAMADARRALDKGFQQGVESAASALEEARASDKLAKEKFAKDKLARDKRATKNAADFKKKIARIETELQSAKQKRAEALANAEATILEQQAEIARLEAELAAKRAGDDY